jgi:hypothetical protein
MALTAGFAGRSMNIVDKGLSVPGRAKGVARRAGMVSAALILAGFAMPATDAWATECTNTNSTTTVCQNPGNSQVNTSPGNTYPYGWWGWPWWNSIGIGIPIGGGHNHR